MTNDIQNQDVQQRAGTQATPQKDAKKDDPTKSAGKDQNACSTGCSTQKTSH